MLSSAERFSVWAGLPPNQHAIFNDRVSILGWDNRDHHKNLAIDLENRATVTPHNLAIDLENRATVTDTTHPQSGYDGQQEATRRIILIR